MYILKLYGTKWINFLRWVRIMVRVGGRIHPYLGISWWGDPGTHSSSSSSCFCPPWQPRIMCDTETAPSLSFLQPMDTDLQTGNWEPTRQCGLSAPNDVLRPLAKQLAASHPALLVQPLQGWVPQLLDLYWTGNSTFGRGRGGERFQRTPFFLHSR